MDTKRYYEDEGDRIELQWGHALSGMDTLASWECERRQTQLQWGHALSGMDTSFTGSIMPLGTTGFNGAMPFQAWIRGS